MKGTVMKDYTTDPGAKARFTRALRDLAGYLDRNPAIPVPKTGETITVHASPADHGGRAQVDHIAGLLDVGIRDETARGGHYWAVRQFGPIGWSGHPVALLIYARRKVTDLAEGGGWDREYPRDTWHMRRLGISSSSCATLQFAGISQQWLRDLTKRWARWRLSTGLEAQTCYRGVRALTRFSGFLAAAGVTGAGGISRDVLERYLAVLTAEMADRRDHRDYIGQVATFLRDVRRHQWDASLPASAVIFLEVARCGRYAIVAIALLTAFVAWIAFRAMLLAVHGQLFPAWPPVRQAEGAASRS
jgi:hypothetical protein